MSGQRQVIMTAEDIDLALQRVALQMLEKNHAVSDLAIVGIHTCGVFLAERIIGLLGEQKEMNIFSGSLDINLYRDDWSLTTQNPVVKTTDIPFEIDNINLVLVDDVLFTGRTIRSAMDALMDYGRPKSIQLAVLVDRGERELPIQPDYCGMKTSIRSDERIQVLLNEHAAKNAVVIES